MEGIALSKEDVIKLLDDPSGDRRAETAAKIASSFDHGDLSDDEMALAEDIFRIMVKDAEILVRQALAQNLKESPNIPHEVAVTLASDVEQVALPILQFSEILTDEDLTDIITSDSADKLMAIASRSTVSEVVSDALVDSHNESVVTRLVENEGAEISEKSLQTVVDNHGGSESVQGAMINRSVLPVTVTERLVTLVSDNMREQLLSRKDLAAEVTEDLFLQSRERAIIGLSSDSSDSDVASLVQQLKDNGRLTPSIILRAACMGNMRFFEASMASLIGISANNTRKLIYDSGDLGLKGLFERAALPKNYFLAIRAAIDVEKETEYDGGENDKERFARRMIERILTQFGDLGVEMESDDLEYLLAKMNELPADHLEFS